MEGGQGRCLGPLRAIGGDAARSAHGIGCPLIASFPPPSSSPSSPGFLLSPPSFPESAPLRGRLSCGKVIGLRPLPKKEEGADRRRRSREFPSGFASPLRIPSPTNPPLTPRPPSQEGSTQDRKRPWSRRSRTFAPATPPGPPLPPHAVSQLRQVLDHFGRGEGGGALALSTGRQSSNCPRLSAFRKTE